MRSVGLVLGRHSNLLIRKSKRYLVVQIMQKPCGHRVVPEKTRLEQAQGAINENRASNRRGAMGFLKNAKESPTPSFSSRFSNASQARKLRLFSATVPCFEASGLNVAMGISPRWPVYSLAVGRTPGVCACSWLRGRRLNRVTGLTDHQLSTEQQRLDFGTVFQVCDQGLCTP